MGHGARGQRNPYHALLSKAPSPRTGSRGRVTRMGLRRVYPLVSDLNTDHRQQMQSRFRAGPILKGECMILPLYLQPNGQANIKN